MCTELPPRSSMSKAKTYEEVLQFAIEREQEAQRDYTAAAKTAKEAPMRDALLEMAAQERGHENKLRGLDVAKFLTKTKTPVPSLDISEYVVAGEFNATMGYPELLSLAMQREKAAYRLYTDLARVTPDPDAAALFKALAQEEARHKLAFEIEYDEHVLQEN
jgi:rubrerythrin